MKKTLPLILAIMMITGFLSGCKKEGAPPTLPPAESMQMDFSNFNSTSKSSEAAFYNKGVDDTYWQAAVFIVGTWRLIIASTLAIPVASFKVASDQDPAFLGDKKWQWSYSVNAAGVTYKARLTGEIRASDVKWEMYVAREGTDAFAEFKWFEGTSKLDGSGGQWILSESNLLQTPILQIDWTKSGTTIGNVKYTYLKSGSSNGAYIDHGLTTSSLNAYFTIHYFSTSLARFSDVNIEWNTTSGNGRIKSSDFLDGEWHCWDTGHLDLATCP
jgi:hypothetical protein